MRYRQSIVVAAVAMIVSVAGVARADDQWDAAEPDRECDHQESDDRVPPRQDHLIYQGEVYAPRNTQAYWGTMRPYWGTMRPYWGTYEPPGVIHRGARTRGLGKAHGLN